MLFMDEYVEDRAPMGFIDERVKDRGNNGVYGSVVGR